MIKSFLFSMAIAVSTLASSPSFADVSQMNTFFSGVSAKGSWTGTGSTTIYSGRFAGTYSISVAAKVTKNGDGSWSLTSDISGMPPQPSHSVAIYKIVGDQIQVTSGQYSSIATVSTLSSTEFDLTTTHTDPVTGDAVTSARQMNLNSGMLSVVVQNLQNNSPFQDYSYQLTSK